MLIYRVAHKSIATDGFPSGPYTTYGLPDEVAERLNDMRWAHSNSSHPSPWKDPKLNAIRDHERCGFDSLEMLYEWFEGWTKFLRDSGFAVYTFEVDDSVTRVGEYGQTVFSALIAEQRSVMELNPDYSVGEAA
jgi:hypothetical protein